jgi:hypothetical protein
MSTSEADWREEEEVIESLKENNMRFGKQIEQETLPYPTSPKAKKIMSYLDNIQCEEQRPLSPKAKNISRFLDSVNEDINVTNTASEGLAIGFFDSSSTATKGRHRVNEPRDFDAKTLHLESHPSTLGVSMLIGTKIVEGLDKDTEKVCC